MRLARPRASTRTSGAGTRLASRSATRRGTRRARRRSSARSSPASGERAAAAHPLRQERALLSRDPSSGRPISRRTRRRIRRRPGSSSRRSTRRRSGRSSAARATRDEAKALPPRAPAEARRVARLPLPRAHQGRRRPRRDLASVGVGHGQLAALGRRARTHHASTRGDPRVPARRRRVRRCGPAPDERRLRPLRVPRQALPRPRTTTPTRIREDCPFVVRDVLFNSLLVAGESRSRRDLARRRATIRSRTRPGPTGSRRASTRRCGTRTRRPTSTTTSARAS